MSEPLMHLLLSRLETSQHHRREQTERHCTWCVTHQPHWEKVFQSSNGMWVAWWKCILSVVTHAEYFEPLQLSHVLCSCVVVSTVVCIGESCIRLQKSLLVTINCPPPLDSLLLADVISFASNKNPPRTLSTHCSIQPVSVHYTLIVGQRIP